MLPGVNPIEAYEAAIANLAPELERRPRPDGVGELLDWAPYPLATAEVIAITGLDPRPPGPSWPAAPSQSLPAPTSTGARGDTR